MKIVKFERDGSTGEGILDGDIITVLGGWRSVAAHEAAFTLPALSPDELTSRLKSAAEKVSLSDVRLAPPCDPMRKIICVGMNYADHNTEIKHTAGEDPVLFQRSLDSLVAPGEPLVRPKVSESYDFEGEIAVVIGKPGRHIFKANALDHVFGYSCFFDGSVRVYQRQALMTGKNFQQTGSMGPWIVTKDEVEGVDFALSTRLNGEQVQAAHASDMIFDIPTIIEYCSRWTTLKPGDVIATGTPGGVGAKREPPLWMKPGDKVEVGISSVGKLSHTVVAEEEG